MKGIFVSGTGTGVGKTWCSLAVVTALRVRFDHVAAMKPVETGVGTAGPADAIALANAADKPDLALLRGLYRAKLPAAPYAALLEGEPPCPAPRALAGTILGAAKAARAQALLVEGAGGLLVPLDAAMTIADLAVELGFPLVLVAEDKLGTLSATFTAERAAMLAGLDLRAVMLNRIPSTPEDPSQRTNARILRDKLLCPVFETTAPDWASSLVNELF